MPLLLLEEANLLSQVDLSLLKSSLPDITTIEEKLVEAKAKAKNKKPAKRSPFANKIS